jgi:catechol 2,3-dioxygenase-like lactoylglutathione lyase family enzyme
MEERPPVWIGHAVLTVSDIGAATSFWSSIGMRIVETNEHVSVLELRGGTHLVLVPGSPSVGAAPFDLMVEDLDATHAAWSAAGIDASPIERGRIHDAFVARDPDGYEVTVNSSHVVGIV